MAEQKIRVMLVSQFPGPPFTGGNIHIYNILRNLSEQIQFHLAYTLPHGDTRPHGIKVLEKHGLRVASYRAFPAPQPLTNWQRLKGLLAPVPPGPAYSEWMWGADLRDYVNKMIKCGMVDLLHIWSPSLAYSLAGITKVPKILTAGDALSFLHYSYAREKKLPQSIYHLIVARQFEKYERGIYPMYKTVILFSERDKNILSRLSNEISHVLIPNGVDTELFRPVAKNKNAVPAFVFHGSFEHYPNVAAAQFLIEHVCPKLVSVLGQNGFCLQLIGKNADGRFKGIMKNHPWLDVKGYVEDLPSVLTKADIYLAPIFSGAGIKNKVLDAMACGLPVVGTNEAFTALTVKDGKQAVIAEKEDFANMALSLLNNHNLQERLSLAGRDLVEQNHSWKTVAKTYFQLYQKVAGIHCAN